MSEEVASKPPMSFYVIGVVALIWNLIGIFVYVLQVTMSPEAIEALPELQRAYVEALPTWVTSAFAIAVNAGALGCILLLLRKSLAVLLFILSLAAVLVQGFYGWFLSNALEAYGIGGVVQSLLTIIISIFLILYAKDAQKKGWLN